MTRPILTAATADPEPSPPLYWAGPGVRLYLGDAATVLRHLPAATVGCVLTSPPYWRLRDYDQGSTTGQRTPAVRGHELGEQVGLEPTLDAYLDRLREVFHEIARVLTPAGTVWLNLADSYAANSDGYYCSRPGQPGQPAYRPRAGIPDKNLLGLPWRVAFALQADGWLLRNAIVWAKPHATPTSSRDRLTTRYEHLFLLTRTADHWFHADGHGSVSTGDRNPVDAPWCLADGLESASDVWTVPTRPSAPGRPPAFPLEIAVRCIRAGSPRGATVLDPFSGAATTGRAARHLGRTYIGIDRNASFHDHARSEFAAQSIVVAEADTPGPEQSSRENYPKPSI
jgi:DNA modification methylase